MYHIIHLYSIIVHFASLLRKKLVNGSSLFAQRCGEGDGGTEDYVLVPVGTHVPNRIRLGTIVLITPPAIKESEAR